ncbi:hypothetical protein [Nocardia grenadensis]|uniref:hypothetical protein n=1 Tax=Nocardia grenadensis TaxID=931537 RepID=UPI003D761689
MPRTEPVEFGCGLLLNTGRPVEAVPDPVGELLMRFADSRPGFRGHCFGEAFGCLQHLRGDLTAARPVHRIL